MHVSLEPVRTILSADEDVCSDCEGTKILIRLKVMQLWIEAWLKR